MKSYVYQGKKGKKHNLEDLEIEIINPNLFMETLEEERKSRHKSITSKVNPMSLSSGKFTEIERLESYRVEEVKKEEEEERDETQG